MVDGEILAYELSILREGILSQTTQNWSKVKRTSPPKVFD
jgi:hypothetical protein